MDETLRALLSVLTSLVIIFIPIGIAENNPKPESRTLYRLPIIPLLLGFLAGVIFLVVVIGPMTLYGFRFTHQDMFGFTVILTLITFFGLVTYWWPTGAILCKFEAESYTVRW